MYPADIEHLTKYNPVVAFKHGGTRCLDVYLRVRPSFRLRQLIYVMYSVTDARTEATNSKCNKRIR